MIIESLKLENFRNISRAGLQFDSDAVFFEGGNGQGKTSLLEAVFYVANLRSFRTLKINELKKLGCPSFHLSLSFLKKQGWKSQLEVDCGLVRTLQADRVPVSKASDFTGKIKTIAFLPDDPLIVSGPSLLRRRFFDMFISLLDRGYFMDLQNYLQALRSRNILLKNHNCNLDILRSYSTVLASSGSEIVRKRAKYVELICGLMKKLFEELYPSLSDFEIRMDFTKETFESESYLKKAENDLKRDLQRGFTTFGPHLDDFEFLFDGKSMRAFGSRGQCRMTSLILKLAELDAVREVSGALNDTVVLVDDATADLDLHARQAFSEKIRTAGQVFFAFTEIPPEFDLEKSNHFKVRSGEIERSD